jgi:hypothetical protein
MMNDNSKTKAPPKKEKKVNTPVNGPEVIGNLVDPPNLTDTSSL